MASDERTLIGWQGMSLWVPAEWTLAAVGGERKQGYLRVDHEGLPRVQVKWASRHIALEKKRDEYVRRLTGAKAKGRRARRVPPVEVMTDSSGGWRISRRSKPGKEMVSYGWRGAQCGVGVLWNCEGCGRAVIAQVQWRQAGERRIESRESQEGGERQTAVAELDLAKEVLDSLEDHGTGGWDAWGVDGLAFLAPERCELEGWRRMTRYLELRFRGHGSGRRRAPGPAGACVLKVARWGMVPLVLRGRGVREWYEAANARRRDVQWTCREETIKGHEGVVAEGERRAWGLRWVGRRLGQAWGRVAGSGNAASSWRFEARAWHCPQSNRLYLVEAVGDGPVEGVVESVRCCAGSGN